MKTKIPGTRLMLGLMMLLLLGTMSFSSSYASIQTLLYSEDFSQGYVPPPGWDAYNVWSGYSYWSYAGANDYDGSWVFNINQTCYGDYIISPSVDASSFTDKDDKVYVEFDAWIEFNGYDFEAESWSGGLGGSYFAVYPDDGSGAYYNNKPLFETDHTSEIYTYGNKDYYANYDPIPGNGYWRHFKLEVPVENRFPNMRFYLIAYAYWNCSGGNIAFDNFSVSVYRAQKIEVTPTELNFGSGLTGITMAQQCVTITNTSASDLNLYGATISGNGAIDYKIVGGVPSTIPAFKSVDVCVDFTPSTDGVRDAVLNISNSSDNLPAVTVPLVGVGLAPLISVDTNIVFKNKFTKLGQTSTAKIKIYSTNLPTLLISQFQIAGLDAGEYFISKYPSSMSIPGNSVDSIEITYRPTKEGRHTAILNIINNSINSPVLPITLWGTGVLPHIVITPKPVLFDSVAIGSESCKSITISNPGTDTLFITSNKFVSNDGDFSYVGLSGTDSIIPPDKSKIVTVCFVPKSKGSRVGRLRLTTNIPKTFEQPSRDTASQFLIDIQGTGVPAGILSQSFSGAEGGGWNDSTIIGNTICIDDVLTNNGDAEITITEVTVVGADKNDYSLSGFTLPFVLSAHSTKTVRLCATPSHRGISTAQLQVRGTASEVPVQGLANLNVKGLLVCASAEPTALFEQTLIYKGSDSTLCTTVTNCGDLAADYTATVNGANMADYVVTPSNVQNILPGASAEFCVKYNPAVSGKSTATLTISSPNTANQTIALGGEAGCAIVNAQLSNLPAMTSGGHYTITVTITNTGTFEWTPTGIEGLDSAYVVKYVSGLAPIAPGGNIQIMLEVSPKEMQKHYTFPLTISGIPCEEAAATATVDFTTGTSGVSSETSEAGFALGQNYPNPVSGMTAFDFTVPTESSVRLRIADLSGATVRELISGRVSAGQHNISMDLSSLSSGTYIYLLEADGVRLLRYLILTK